MAALRHHLTTAGVLRNAVTGHDPATAKQGRYTIVEIDIAAVGVADMAKATLLASPPRDHRALAEQQIAAGRKDKAAQLYLRAGDFERAARLAAEIGDERLAVEAALRATLGAVPEGYAAAGAHEGAELLAVKGHHREAAELFELARAWRQAAEAALKLQQPARAARLYERGRLFGDAALYYSRAGLAEDELRVLKLESARTWAAAPAAGSPRPAIRTRRCSGSTSVAPSCCAAWAGAQRAPPCCARRRRPRRQEGRSW